MARREPITDIHLRELAIKRFQIARYLKADGESVERRCEPMRPAQPDPLRATVTKLIRDEIEIPADSRDGVIDAVYGEIDLYRIDKLIGEHEGPDSVAESIRLRVEVLKSAQQALLELPAIPHRSAANAGCYFEAHDRLRCIIDAEEAEMARQNLKVSPRKPKKSPTPAQRQGTELRDALAVALKDIAVSHLKKSEDEARGWVANVFDTLRAQHSELGLKYPSDKTHPDKFKAMFIRLEDR